jgi:hypothetical protein
MKENGNKQAVTIFSFVTLDEALSSVNITLHK